MFTQKVVAGPLTAYLRECWIVKSNRRLSALAPCFSEPMLHAVVVESISVEKSHRLQGHCKRFLQTLLSDERFELVVVEGVQNNHLADALMRWGWDFDPVVMDFYQTSAAKPATLTKTGAAACEGVTLFFHQRREEE